MSRSDKIAASRSRRGSSPRSAPLRRQRAAPQGEPFGRARRQEIDDEAQPPHESRIEILAAVGRQDGDAVEALDPLQQIVDLDIGEAVVRVLHLRAAAEQRVGLVEEQQRAAVLAGVEHVAQPLLGLADIFVDHAGQINAQEVEAERAGQHLRGHGLAGAGWTAE